MANSSRRKFIQGIAATLGTLGLGGWLGKRKILTWYARSENRTEPNITPAPAMEEDMCVLSSPISEGPYYLQSPFRRDIREGKQGKTLHLSLQVVDYPDCKPIEQAIVEIWQCDAGGNYSGYPEGIGHDIWASAKLMEFGKKQHVEPVNNNQFLRGCQTTDTNGKVEFTTIIPGWYAPRVPHIHYKIILNEREHLTSEFFFEESFYNGLFRKVLPYTQYGISPYTFKNDKSLAIVKEGTGLILKPSNNADNSVSASAKVGIILV